MASPAIEHVHEGPPFALTTTSSSPGEIRVAVRGEIDLHTASDLRAGLLRLVEHPSCATIVVDLGDVGFMGAHGVSVLLDVREHAADRSVSLLFVTGGGAVRRLLRMLGVDDLPVALATGAVLGGGGRG